MSRLTFVCCFFRVFQRTTSAALRSNWALQQISLWTSTRRIWACWPPASRRHPAATSHACWREWPTTTSVTNTNKDTLCHSFHPCLPSSLQATVSISTSSHLLPPSSSSQVSPSSRGRWANTRSASWRTAVMSPTVPSPSWSSSLRSETPA